MRIARFDSGLHLDDPNLRWGNPCYLLEPGDPGYVADPTSASFPLTKPSTKRKTMPKTDRIKHVERELSNQMLQFSGAIGTYATVLGVSPTQVAAQAADGLLIRQACSPDEPLIYQAQEHAPDERMNVMHALRSMLSILVALATGCSSHVVITIKDQYSHTPLTGIRVERHRSVSTLEAVFNPIGASYHPLRLAGVQFSDASGRVTFNGTDVSDVYRVFVGNARPVEVTIFDRTLDLSGNGTSPGLTNWGYSLWLEHGNVKHTAWPMEETESDNQ